MTINMVDMSELVYCLSRDTFPGYHPLQTIIITQIYHPNRLFWALKGYGFVILLCSEISHTEEVVDTQWGEFLSEFEARMKQNIGRLKGT